MKEITYYEVYSEKNYIKEKYDNYDIALLNAKKRKQNKPDLKIYIKTYHIIEEEIK